MAVLVGLLIVAAVFYQMFFRYESWENDKHPGVRYEYDHLTGETREIEPGAKTHVIARVLGEGGQSDWTGEQDAGESRFLEPLTDEALQSDEPQAALALGEEPREPSRRLMQAPDETDLSRSVTEIRQQAAASLPSRESRHSDSTGTSLKPLVPVDSAETRTVLPHVYQGHVSKQAVSPEAPLDLQNTRQVARVARPVPLPRSVLVAMVAPPVPMVNDAMDRDAILSKSRHRFAVRKMDLNRDGAPEDVIQNASQSDGLLDISIVQAGREVFFARGRQISMLPSRRKGWADIVVKTASQELKVYRYDPDEMAYRPLEESEAPVPHAPDSEISQR